MGNRFLKEIQVGAVQSSLFDAGLIDSHVKTFSNQPLRQLHRRALAQIIRAFLERKADQTNSPSPGFGNEVDATIQMNLVAMQNRTEHRKFEPPLADF